MLKKIINFLKHPENYTNRHYLKYHFLKLVQKIRRRYKIFNNKLPDVPANDMFNWSLYNIHYRGEMKENNKINTVELKKGDYAYKKGNLIKENKKIKPLNENWRLIYETVLDLKPDSVLELGCGNGMHINNIQTLAPEIKLFGLDRDKEQINYLRQIYPQLKAGIRETDATKPFPAGFLPKVDLSFTQAVIMHLYTNNSHLGALANLFNISNKYVVLMERWKNHNIMEDILNLKKEGKINWNKIYFYYKVSEETKRPHLMICSNHPLRYPELTSYDLFPKK